MAMPELTDAPASISADELRKRIFQSPQSNAGSYGEGAIAMAVQAFKDLQDQLAKGKITQQQYVDVAGQVAPEVQNLIGRLQGGGSRSANAAQAAGASTFNNEIGRDLDIYKSGRELLGRDLTQNEVYQLRPRFAGPNGADVGKAYLAEIANQEAKSPEALGKKAPEYAGKVNDLFGSLLNRKATANESDYYGKLLASGEVSPYEAEQYIKAGQEYQGGQDKSFREGLKGELMGYNQEAFKKATPEILSQYAKAGGGISASSDLDFAIANAMKELNEGSDQFLSTLSSSQYGGNKEAARGDYQTMLNTYLANKTNATNRSNSLLDYYTQRADQGTDYQRQMDDYMSFLNNQPKKKKGGLGGALGPLLGMGAGALFAAPTGGMSIPAGAKLGAQFGKAGGGLFDWNYE